MNQLPLVVGGIVARHKPQTVAGMQYFNFAAGKWIYLPPVPQRLQYVAACVLPYVSKTCKSDRLRQMPNSTIHNAKI